MNFTNNSPNYDIKELKNMFIDVFSEDSRFVDMMFENKLTPDNTFIVKENDTIISMAYGMYFDCIVNKASGKCVYVYGVATDKNYRGKGYMTKIMDDIYNHYKEDKELLFLYLVPASADLFPMYEKLGYETVFYLNRHEYDLSCCDYPAAEIKSGDFHDDYIIYIKQFDNVIVRSRLDNRLALKECAYEKVGESGFLYCINNDIAYIREAYIYSIDDLRGFLGYLKSKGAHKAILTSKPEKKGNNQPYAMVKTFQPIDFSGTSYTNINFD